VTINREQNKVL